MDEITRRTFLKYLSYGSAVALLVSTGGCEQLLKQIENRPRRRCISTLASNDPIIQTYKDAVSAMKALPASDPRNWTKQAQIHFNHCPHSNWFFLPWHRAYLFYFEKICQQLTGNHDFGLPYWNWTGDKRVPAAFCGGASNPLFDSNRVATQSSVISDAVVGETVVNDILNEPNFLLFASGMSSTQRGSSTYGRLEGTPHNSVHGFVGGDMGAFMSPLDPVFWCHHNMVERCWVDWNIVRGHANTNDSDWMNFIFAGDFVDAAGNAVDIKVVTTLLMPLLSYQYDNFVLGSCGLMPPSSVVRDTEALRKFLKEGAPVKLEFYRQVDVMRAVDVQAKKPTQLSVRVEPELMQNVIAPNRPERVLLAIDEVTLPQEDDFYVRVFVNHPDASADTPISDPHYAGSFAFFSDAHIEHGGNMQPGYLVDITETVRTLKNAGALTATDKINVQLVMAPLIENQPLPARQFRFERARLGFMR